MTLEARKFRIIKSITELEDENSLLRLELLLENIEKEHKLMMQITQSMQEKIDSAKAQSANALKIEEIDAIVKEVDVSDSIEELLSMI